MCECKVEKHKFWHCKDVGYQCSSEKSHQECKWAFCDYQSLDWGPVGLRLQKVDGAVLEQGSLLGFLF